MQFNGGDMEITKNRFTACCLLEDNINNKNKKTLGYYESNLKFLGDYIKNRLRHNGLPVCDSDIILSDLYISLLNSRDYGDDSNDFNYTIESFVIRNAKFCIDRYTSVYSKHCKKVTNDFSSNSDGEEYSKLNSIEDCKASIDMDRTECDFYNSLKRLEYKRNCFGVDVYNLLLVGICNFINGSTDKFKEIIGIGGSDINKAYNLAVRDEDFHQSLCAAASTGSDTACLLELKKFVYNFEHLIKAIGIDLV